MNRWSQGESFTPPNQEFNNLGDNKGVDSREKQKDGVLAGNSNKPVNADMVSKSAGKGVTVVEY